MLILSLFTKETTDDLQGYQPYNSGTHGVTKKTDSGKKLNYLESTHNLQWILSTFLVQVCLCAPPVVAVKAKLAIVFTYFFSSFFLRLLLFTHWETPWLKICFPRYYV